MPRINWSNFPLAGVSPLEDAVYERRGWQRINGRWLDPESYNIARRERLDADDEENVPLLQREGDEGAGRNERGGGMFSGMLDSVREGFQRGANMPVSPNEIRASDDISENPWVRLGINYALGDFSERNPFLGLILRNIVRGGVGTAVSGNPVAGAITGVGGALKELPQVIADIINKSRRQRFSPIEPSAPDVVPDTEVAPSKPSKETFLKNIRERLENMPGTPEERLERIKQLYNSLPEGEGSSAEFVIAPQLTEGEDVDAARERLRQQKENAQQLTDPVNAYRDLVMQRVINFTIPGRERARSNDRTQGVKVTDLLKKLRISGSSSLLSSIV